MRPKIKRRLPKPLAKALQQAGLKVWYDKFALKLGTVCGVRLSAGSESKYGVVILSPAFFAKKWTQKELDWLATRELHSEKIILPVWHQVTYDDVLRFSPDLADKLAVSTSEGLAHVIQQILHVCLEQTETVKGSEQQVPPRIRLRSEPLECRQKSVGPSLNLMRTGDRLNIFKMSMRITARWSSITPPA